MRQDGVHTTAKTTFYPTANNSPSSLDNHSIANVVYDQPWNYAALNSSNVAVSNYGISPLHYGYSVPPHHGGSGAIAGAGPFPSFQAGDLSNDTIANSVGTYPGYAQGLSQQQAGDLNTFRLNNGRAYTFASTNANTIDHLSHLDWYSRNYDGATMSNEPYEPYEPYEQHSVGWTAPDLGIQGSGAATVIDDSNGQ